VKSLIRPIAVITAALCLLTATGEAFAANPDAGGIVVRDVCAAPAPGHARCFARVRTDLRQGHGLRSAAAPPAGYGPAELRAAYHLPATGGANQTVAVVDAGDDADAEADLATYRTTYGLPPCTTSNGCFRKVNQKGQPSPLPADTGWGVEIALDLDMVSAACPQCKILLVEGDDEGLPALAAAENTAVALHATEISNSYGAEEYGDIATYAPAYHHPGVAITVSSGDSGYLGSPEFPAVLTSVIAVGGTSLRKANNTRGWTETTWNSDGGAAGSGCSAWIAKPAWQHDKNCPGRMIADVASDADPQTGPAIYATVDGATGWLVAGGTSASSPYIAGVIALAGHPGRYPNAAYLYAHPTGLYDITSGNNALGTECGGDYQCQAKPGYDGPTGLGTPHGLTAF